MVMITAPLTRRIGTYRGKITNTVWVHGDQLGVTPVEVLTYTGKMLLVDGFYSTKTQT